MNIGQQNGIWSVVTIIAFELDCSNTYNIKELFIGDLDFLAWSITFNRLE